MNLWTWAIATALALLAAAAVYVRVIWKRAPAAFRAMTALGIVCALAGIAIGYSASHLLPAVFMRPHWKSADSPPDPAITNGKVPASDVGKSIVLMDEKHSDDPMSVPSGSLAETCDLEAQIGEKLSPTWHRHILGAPCYRKRPGPRSQRRLGKPGRRG